MARTVADLRLGLEVLAGRDIRDPRSVDVPLHGPAPLVRRAALVTQIPGTELPPETVTEIERAGRILAEAGWEVGSAEPPELELVNETWLDLIAIDFSVLMPRIRAMVSRPLYDYMMDLCGMSRYREKPNSDIHATRSRLTRLWSGFFAQYAVAIGPTWTQLPWRVDADLLPGIGATAGPGHGEVHHSRQRPGAAVGGLAHGSVVRAAHGDPDLCGSVAGGSGLGGSRGHRTRRRPTHSDRSAEMTEAGVTRRAELGSRRAPRSLGRPGRRPTGSPAARPALPVASRRPPDPPRPRRPPRQRRRCARSTGRSSRRRPPPTRR